MAQITAALVKELRERTGAGMMDCKKALTAVEGDMDKAIDFLREKGLAAAAKKAGRIAAEGVVGSFVSADGKIGAIVEVNCETDFVAKTDGFKELVEKIAAHIVATKPADVEALLASELDGQTVEALVTASVAKIGEKISVRRFALYEAPEGVVATYIHGGGKIGVVVELKGGNAELGKDVAMHVAAANPSYLNALKYRLLSWSMRRKFCPSKLKTKANLKKSSRRWLWAVSTNTTKKYAWLTKSSLKIRTKLLANW